MLTLERVGRASRVANGVHVPGCACADIQSHEELVHEMIFSTKLALHM